MELSRGARVAAGLPRAVSPADDMSRRNVSKATVMILSSGARVFAGLSCHAQDVQPSKHLFERAIESYGCNEKNNR
jgi:hypothetical protein